MSVFYSNCLCLASISKSQTESGSTEGPLCSKNLPDDVFNGDFLDVYVGDGEFVEEGFTGGNDVVALHFKREGGGGLLGDFAVAGEFRGGNFIGLLALDGDELEVGEAVHDVAQFAVEEDFAVVNDDDALAERLDVGHVMAGEENGGFLGGVVAADKFANGLLGNDVEADGGLVEKQDAGLVEQGGDEFHFHAFAQTQLADGDVELVLDAEEFGQLGDGFFEAVLGDAVDFGVELEGFAGGEVPPELIFLAEDEGELAAVAVGALPGSVTEDFGRASRGKEEAGEHFEGGGFAGAVGAEKTDEFAGFDLEADVVDGDGLLVLAIEQALDRAGKAGLLFVGAKSLGQAVNLDDGHPCKIGKKEEGKRKKFWDEHPQIA